MLLLFFIFPFFVIFSACKATNFPSLNFTLFFKKFTEF